MTYICSICKKHISLINVFTHTKFCYENKIDTLFIDFDRELSSIKKDYDNKICKIKNCMNMKELCENCKYNSGRTNVTAEIEDLLLKDM